MSTPWSARERTAEVQAVYNAAEADRAANPARYELDPEALIARAFSKAQPAPDDDGDWREGFDIYVRSAREEGRLNALGQRSMASTAVGRLKARLAIARALKARPEAQARPINRPIFIIGGWRTGTTLLQRLLSALPGLRALFPAELSVPWRFTGLSEEERAVLLDAGDEAHKRLHLFNPAMQVVHPSGARLAEECVLAMGTDMRNWGFTSTLRCPSYTAWLARQDLAPSYRRYADILRLLQDDDHRRWILKAPAHTAELPALHAAFPDACIVHLHRDVVETVASGASLFATFRSTYSDGVDAAEIGRYQLETTALWFDRAMTARERHPTMPVLDVSFGELTADPVAIAAKICRAFDVAWTSASEEAGRAGLAGLRGQHARHPYSAEQFGLDPDEIRSRLAAYRSRFGVS